MKLAFAFFALASTTASAFTVQLPQQQQRPVTELKVSTTPQDFNQNGWENKPLYEKKVSTTPVPVRKVNPLQRKMMKDVVIAPSYYLAGTVGALGPLIALYHPAMADGSPSLMGVFGAGFHILFAALLWVQTARVRCVFEKDSFEFYNVKGPGLDYEGGKAELVKKPDNYVAGTLNRWKYDSIVNYGFFPSEQFPVICYFKETETPEWKWNRWFAAFDSYGRGQPHFFPGICNVRQFKEQMESRGVKRKPIPTLHASKKE